MQIFIFHPRCYSFNTILRIKPLIIDLSESNYRRSFHMDFNTLLTRFGFNSSNFVNKTIEPIPLDEGFIYEVEEDYRIHLCPHCNNELLHIHGYKWIEIKLSSNLSNKEYLRVKRIRYKCPKCGKTHTFPLEGIERNKVISNYVETAIKKEFFEVQSFSTIAKRYDISTMQVIRIFDKFTEKVPRRPLPECLCIDEKHFESESGGKYAVVLSDFYSGEIIDVLENRQMPYLERYFSNISFSERSNVKVFISDMYDGYSRIKNRFFPKALFVIDLFHVVKNLATAINKLRIRTYNHYTYDETIERHFMKTNWRFFLMDERRIRHSDYHSKKYDVYIPYSEIILRCLKKNIDFWDGYTVLQELLHYDRYDTFTEAMKFIERIIAKLTSSGNDLLCKVAESYSRLKVGIVHGLAKNQTEKRFSNAIAENNNTHIQRVIDIAYGYKNFKRFRARIMLILTYKNQR